MAQPVQLTLHRRQVDLDAARGVDGLLDAVAALTPADARANAGATWIAVNIGTTLMPQPLLFCAANVATVVRDRPTAVVIDVASEEQFAQFARTTLDATIALACGVRAQLRSTPVGSCGPQLQTLCQQLDLVTLMVDGYALQLRDSAVADIGRRVGRCARAVAEAAGRADNVCCMDDLHYELLPTLTAAVAAFDMNGSGALPRRPVDSAKG